MSFMDFNQIIDRSSTYSLKWEKYRGRDILPLWVADTEFQCAQPILDALKQRVDHGLLGYTHPSQYSPANEAIIHWLKQQHQWDIKPEWIVWTPGVVPAFNVACLAYCQPGDKVMVQMPNYPPLLAAPGINKMERVDIPSIEVAGRLTIDLDNLAQQAADPKCKLLILCNPMNPLGSVLTADELQAIADICRQHNVLLCSDEIHCDLILEPGHTHIPAGKHQDLAERSITLMAASKTFNVAGLGTSFAIIPDPRLRAEFNQAMAGIMPWVTILGLVATETAFTQCDDWYNALIPYLRDNRDYLVNAINALPGLRCISPEATFLAWVDGSGLDVPSPQRHFEALGVGPSPGADFGAHQFIRLNFGCPRQYLEQAIERLQALKA